MGGGKLKLSQPYRGVFFAVLVLTLGYFTIPLSAQTPEPPSESHPEHSSEIVDRSSPPDESTIILGETPVSPGSNDASSIFVVIRMIMVLALSALAIYGVFFFIKRLARPRESRDPHLKVLARAPLSNDSFAAVISVGPKAWLVGGGAGSVNLISEIDDTETLETMLLDDARRADEEGTRRFVDFRSLIKRFSAAQSRQLSNDPKNPHADVLRKQRERLKGL